MMVDNRIRIIIMLMISSCSQNSGISKSKAVLEATKYVESHPIYSRSYIDIDNVEISENSEEFVFKFSPIKGYIGGSPTVYVRKRDGKIIKVISTQ